MTAPPDRRQALAERIRRTRARAADQAAPGGTTRRAAAAPPASATGPQARIVSPGAIVLHDVAGRTLGVAVGPPPAGPLIQELAALFTDEDRRALNRVISGPERELVHSRSETDRALVCIGLGLGRGITGLAERTGLTAAAPPLGLDPLSDLPWSTGGDPWHADLVDTALSQSGSPLAAGQRALAIGAVCGRVVRVLAARRPGVAWAACDVDGAAVAWAAANLPGITFAEQPLDPPLAYGDASFDVAYGLSLWAHSSETAALLWLEEARRVLRPGGHLMLATHGLSAAAAGVADPGLGAAAQEPLLGALHAAGFAFAFAPPGPSGARSSWGTAYFTPEWLLTHASPEWSVSLYRPRAIGGLQDLYVLRRER